MIVKKTSKKFGRQLANGIIMSKVNYNIETWGNTTSRNRKKIDKIIVEAARITSEKNTEGRTDEWILKEARWLNTENNYINTIQNMVYKIINNQDEHYFKHYLTNTRNIRNKSHNKVGHHSVTMGRSKYTQQTFLYMAIDIYNRLPKEITLIKYQRRFKIWVKKYNLNNMIKLKSQDDNMEEIKIQEINEEIIIKCQEEY